MAPKIYATNIITTDNDIVNSSPPYYIILASPLIANYNSPKKKHLGAFKN